MWWPGAIATSDYQQSLQSHHQHLLNQHHQQQLAAQQHQQQQQQAQQQASQHDAVARSTAAAAATQQLFSYKMASSFQNPATTMTSATVSSSSPVASCMRGYDYSSGGMVGAGGRSGDAGSAPQWWYPSGMANSIQNVPSPPAVVRIVACVGSGGGECLRFPSYRRAPCSALVFLYAFCMSFVRTSFFCCHLSNSCANVSARIRKPRHGLMTPLESPAHLQSEI